MQKSIQQSTHTYSILDAARIFGEMETARTLQTNFLSLYMGSSEELLGSVAPYLFAYQPDSDFAKWLLENGWGNSWGIFIKTNLTIEEVRKHFRKFVLVKTEDGKELYFRFYDPRVLRIFLPTCDKQQIMEFFGPIDYFIVESETKEEAIVFKHRNGELVEERIPANKVFGELAEEKTPVTKGPEELPEGKKPPRRFIY